MVSEFSGEIYSDFLDPIRPELTIRFNQNFILYIRINKAEEYSYHIEIGSAELNRIRFDNMDTEWDVSTKPHHFHLKNRDDIAENSPMTGKIEDDMKHLIAYIREELL